MSDLAHLLRSCDCEKFGHALAAHGVHSAKDLTWLTEDDLFRIGFNLIERRKLQYACGLSSACPCPSTISSSASPDYREHILMQQKSWKAELGGIVRLSEVIIWAAEEVDSEVKEFASQAKKHLVVLASTYGMNGVCVAIKAENAASHALSQCRKKTSKGCSSQVLLEQVIRSIRDIVVLRTQMECVQNTRDCFMETLTRAYGAPLTPPQVSKLMVAHGKVVPQIVRDIFLSNSQKINLARPQGTRTKRSRDRLRMESEKKNAEHAAEASEEVEEESCVEYYDAVADSSADASAAWSSETAGIASSSSCNICSSRTYGLSLIHI